MRPHQRPSGQQGSAATPGGAAAGRHPHTRRQNGREQILVPLPQADSTTARFDASREDKRSKA
jgi:hypothetical protein